jgi:hypothetical protein
MPASSTRPVRPRATRVLNLPADLHYFPVEVSNLPVDLHYLQAEVAHFPADLRHLHAEIANLPVDLHYLHAEVANLPQPLRTDRLDGRVNCKGRMLSGMVRMLGSRDALFDPGAEIASTPVPGGVLRMVDKLAR